MSVTAGVVLKRAAEALATDKRTWKVIASIVAGFIILCLLPAMVLLNMTKGISGIRLDNSALQNQIMSNLSSSQKEHIADLSNALTAITNEIKAQNLNIDPAKAQLIYVSVLPGREKSDSNFYQRYVQCFENAQDDNTLFERLSSEFSLTITAQDREKILQLYSEIQKHESKKESSHFQG